MRFAAASVRLPALVGQTALQGYSRRGSQPSRSSSDRKLEANIILLGKSGGGYFALIAIDALYATNALASEVAELAKLPAGDVALVASHTHTAPGLDAGKPALGPVAPDYIDSVAELLGKHLKELLSKPLFSAASAQLGQSECTQNIYRRRKAFNPRAMRYGVQMAPNRAVAVSHAVEILTLADEAGEVRAAVWSWPCHPTSAPDPLALDADFPAVVRDRLREVHGIADLPVLFLPGFCGDIRHANVTPFWSPRNLLRHLGIAGFGRVSAQRFAELADALRKSASKAVSEARTVALYDDARVTRSSVPTTPFMLSDDVESETHLAFVDLGDVAIFCCGAEVSHAYRNVVAGVFAGKTVLSTGCLDGVFGYLPTKAQSDEGGYEGGGFVSEFGLKGHLAPDCEGAFVSAIRALGVRA
ncbi:hypothetical protein ACXYN8_08665 [Altererythrobacter sp. CAU 1778]